MIGNLATSKPIKLNFAFTLIELLVVMAVIAVLLTLAVPRYFGSIDKSKEAALKEDLSIMRDAIDKYFGDTGKYPMVLEDLATRHYLKEVPVDPITERADTWVTFPPPDVAKGKVYDVKSGSNLTASNGKPYSDW